MVETSVLVKTILQLDKKKPTYLSDIHKDVFSLVKELYQDKDFNEGVGQDVCYHAADGNILDAYKNVVHVMLLEEIPGFKNNDDTVRVDRLLEGIHKKYNLNDDLTTLNDIRDKLQNIIDKHCCVSLITPCRNH